MPNIPMSHHKAARPSLHSLSRRSFLSTPVFALRMPAFMYTYGSSYTRAGLHVRMRVYLSVPVEGTGLNIRSARTRAFVHVGGRIALPASAGVDSQLLEGP